MQLDLFVASADQMVDDVRRRGIAASATEPLIAGETLDNASSIVDATISTQVCLVSYMISQVSQPHSHLRAGMSGELDIFFRLQTSFAVYSIHGHADHALHIIVIIDVCLFVIVQAPSPCAC